MNALAHARRAIARAWLGDASEPRARLGQVTLRPHQLHAVERLGTVLARLGGALLADEVGLGKTYVALALAADATHPLIIAPAALREMWAAARTATGIASQFASTESLSRGLVQRGACDFLVVDEAHYFRNPGTRRYHALASLAASVPILLLTATPLHNRRGDLTALLGLFLGARAQVASDDELARCIVRRTRADLALTLPSATPPTWLPLPERDDVLEVLLSLPPPVPPADGGDASELVALSLVRQWASSDAALRAALRRRLARAIALATSLESGRYPTLDALRAWTFADDSVQLAFPEFLPARERAADSVPGRESPPVGELLCAIRRHAAGLRTLLAMLPRDGGPDEQRAAHLRDLRNRHSGAKIVAFSQFADTVTALFQRLAGEPAVAALTAGGAAVAGGALSRPTALARFAPTAQSVSPPRPAERIDLLLTTDLLSEGVNLQDASVLVHLDLPWTPARIEQRVGRLRRLGSPHDIIAVYAMTPPASAERVVRAERALRDKAAMIGLTLGGNDDVLSRPNTSSRPRSGGGRGELSAPELVEQLFATFSRWRSDAGNVEESPAGETMAAVHAPENGFVAACDVDDERVVVASLNGGPVIEDPALLARAIRFAGGAPLPDGPSPECVAAARAAIRTWASARRAARDAGDPVAPVPSVHRAVASRIAAITRRSPRHRRPFLANLAADARRVAAAPRGAGGERALATLARAPLDDVEWLRAVGATAARPVAGQQRADSGTTPTWRLVALIVLASGLGDST